MLSDQASMPSVGTSTVTRLSWPSCATSPEYAIVAPMFPWLNELM